MTSIAPAVVIDNGTANTRAGFALEDTPSVVFDSHYLVDEAGNVLVGAENINTRPELEVMTLLDNGVVYNFDHIVHNWNHVYKQLDGGNGADPKDHPLMITEQTWNTSRNRASAAQVAFEQLEVPLFSVVKSPLAQLYHMGRSTGLVVDVGAGVASVTPVLDGIIQHKLCFHTKYAGDFASLHAMRSIEAKLGYAPAQIDFARLLPRQFAAGPVSESFRRYHATHNLLHNFKQTMLHVSEPPAGLAAANQYYQPPPHPHPPVYQLADGSHVPYVDPELLAITEPLYVPHVYKLPGVEVPEPAFDKAATHGISNLVLFTLKNLEMTFMSNVAGDGQNSDANARFNEILRQLFSNILITGGCSLLPGFSDRLCGDLSRSAPLILPNYPVTGSYKLYISPLRNYSPNDINDTLEKQFGSWLGAANLANMLNETVEDEAAAVNIALDNWFISKAEYEELGEDLIVEKFK